MASPRREELGSIRRGVSSRSLRVDSSPFFTALPSYQTVACRTGPRQPGSVYGLTLVDGANGVGTAFKLTKAGVIAAAQLLQHADLQRRRLSLLYCAGDRRQLVLRDGTAESAYERFVPHESGWAFKALHTLDTKTQPDGLEIFNVVQRADGKFNGTTVAGSQLKMEHQRTGSRAMQPSGSSMRGLRHPRRR